MYKLPIGIKITPMLKQYVYWKNKYPECLLFFRVGDFYELFFEDAKVASAELDIVLTSRSKDQSNPIPMAGVPHHAVTSYINRLVTNGFKIAICEQITEPDGKTIVERKVTRVITPGTWLPEESDTDAKIAAVYFSQKKVLIALLESGSGIFKAGTFELERALSLLTSFNPNEIVVSKAQKDQLDILKNEFKKLNIVERDRSEFLGKNAYTRFCKRWNITTLNSMGFDDLDPVIAVASVALNYLEETQFSQARHVSSLRPILPNENLILDRSTQLNLELVESNYLSLFSILNNCRTSMGRRLLKEWILSPLQDIEEIKKRQLSISELLKDIKTRNELIPLLAQCRDISKSVGRLTLNISSPSDLLAIKQTLQILPNLIEHIKKIKKMKFLTNISDLTEITILLKNAISDSVPRFIRDGGVIKEGYDKELDRWRDRKNNSSSWLLEFEQIEKDRTGIKSLKTGVNKIFGYYIEIPKSNINKAPLNYIRKQTLVAAERYITEELKEFEKEIFSAEEKIIEIEEILYLNLKERVMKESKAIQEASNFIATIDVLLSLAEIAFERDYTCPTIDLSRDFIVRGARHPVIEVSLGNNPFTPNDYKFSPDIGNRIAIITGPNMAGKSTYLRTAALIAIMAHMGAYIPAEEAKIGLIDRVFTRIGARDELARGQSTFMVEMVETANIVKYVTERSLVILDEVGRGTSTYDGLSIAWSIIEYLHAQENRQAKVLFATHYHELTKLPEKLPGIVNLSMAVNETHNGITFLHKVIHSPSDKSYGIEVARLAGLPHSVLKRSRELLERFEENIESNNMDGIAIKKQMTLFNAEKDSILEELQTINPDNISPLEALELLYKLKEKSKRALT